MNKIFLTLLLLVSLTAESQVTTLVNSDFNEAHITKREVRNLYLLKSRRLSDGQTVVLFQLPTNSKLHKLFVREVLDMSVEKYLQEIDRLVNAGLNTNIIIVNNKEEMMYKVSSAPSGIGYIDNDYLLMNDGNRGVKILKIVE